jgi:pimeloyl-ACP methyl ester carboxylesterase
VLKVVKVVVIVLVALGLIGSAALGKMIADQVMYQNKGNDTKSNSVKQLVDIWGYDLDGFNASFHGEEISATAADGNIGPGTAFRADAGSDTWVVLVHGAGGDRVSVYPLAEQYLIRGYNVIAIDQRGCGDNADDKVTFGIHESLDVAAMVQYARETLGAAEVIAHGQSMGAQTVAIYASKVTPGAADAADAVICDSPVPGMEYMLRSVFADSDNEEDFYNGATNYMIFVSKVATKLLYKVDYADGDTIAAVAGDLLPTMLIRSEKDQVCLPEKVQEVYNNVGAENKTIMSVDSAHIEGVIDDPEGYMDGVMCFLESCGL